MKNKNTYSKLIKVQVAHKILISFEITIILSALNLDKIIIIITRIEFYLKKKHLLSYKNNIIN